MDKGEMEMAECDHLNQVATLRRPRRGFTLIELLVVCAILAILVVVLTAVGTNVRQRAQITKTKSTLKALDGVLQDYERDTGTKLNPVLNWNGQPDSKYMDTFLSYPKTRDQISHLVQQQQIAGTNTINDGFGNQISLVGPPYAARRGFMSNGPDGVNNPTTPTDSANNDNIYSWDP